MDSILTSTKKLLGISEDDESFDVDVITHINTAFFTLNQLGVGPNDPFVIDYKNSTWNEFTKDERLLRMVRTYVYLSVKKVFDPPLSSVAMNSINELIKEYEWRLNVAVDPLTERK